MTGRMDTDAVISAAQRAHATEIGKAGATERFRAAQQAEMVVYMHVSPRLETSIKKKVFGPELAVSFQPPKNSKVPVSQPHVGLVAARRVIRSQFNRHTDVTDGRRYLVLGATSYEVIKYWNNPNVSFLFDGREPKDAARIFSGLLKDQRISEAVLSFSEESKREILDQICQDNISEDFCAGRLNPGQPRPGYPKGWAKVLRFKTFTELADALNSADPVAAMARLPGCTNRFYVGLDTVPLHSHDVLLMFDMVYNLYAEDYLRFFAHTGAHTALGYAAFPYELTHAVEKHGEKHFPAMPDWYYTFKRTEENGEEWGEMLSNTWANGYRHNLRSWRVLPMNTVLGGVLHVDFVSEVGIMREFEITRRAVARKFTAIRTLQLPDRFKFVLVMDPHSVWDQKRKRFTMEKARYIPVLQNEFYPIYHFLMTSREDMVTLSNALLYIRSRAGGVAMINVDLLESWDLKPKHWGPVALTAVLLATYRLAEGGSFKKVMKEYATVNRVKKAIGLMATLFWKLYDWIFTSKFQDKLVLEQGEPVDVNGQFFGDLTFWEKSPYVPEFNVKVREACAAVKAVREGTATERQKELEKSIEYPKPSAPVFDVNSAIARGQLLDIAYDVPGAQMATPLPAQSFFSRIDPTIQYVFEPYAGCGADTCAFLDLGKQVVCAETDERRRAMLRHNTADKKVIVYEDAKEVLAHFDRLGDELEDDMEAPVPLMYLDAPWEMWRNGDAFVALGDKFDDFRAKTGCAIMLKIPHDMPTPVIEDCKELIRVEVVSEEKAVVDDEQIIRDRPEFSFVASPGCFKRPKAVPAKITIPKIVKPLVLTQQAASCTLCAQLGDIGDQIIDCPGQAWSFEEVLTVDPSAIRALVQRYEEGIEKNGENKLGQALAIAKKTASKFLETGVTTSEIRFHVFEGGPGTGKSFIAKKLLGNKDMMASPYRDVLSDYKGVRDPNASYIDGEGVLREFDKTFIIKTQDHALNGLFTGELFIDEYTAFPYEKMAIICAVNSVSNVYLFGDKKQTGTRDEIEGMAILQHLKGLHTSNPHELLVNHRSPPDTVEFLNFTGGYRMIPHKCRKSCAKMHAVEKSILYGTENPFLKTGEPYQDLCFTQDGKGAADIAGTWKTVRETQGKTFQNVVVHLNDISDVGTRDDFVIVSLSRHRGKVFVLYDPSKSGVLTQKFLDRIKEYEGSVATRVLAKSDKLDRAVLPEPVHEVKAPRERVAKDRDLPVPPAALAVVKDVLPASSQISKTAVSVLGDGSRPQHGKLREDFQIPTTSRGNIRREREYYSVSTGMGNHFSSLNPTQSLASVFSRYAQSKPNSALGEEARATAELIAENAIRVMFDDANHPILSEVEIGHLAHKYDRDLRELHVDMKCDEAYSKATNARIIRFFLKSQFKSYANHFPADKLVKVGQGVSAWAPSTAAQYRFGMRLAMELFVRSLKVNCTTDHGMTQFEFVQRCAEFVQKDPESGISLVGANQAYVDFTAFDSMQNAFTQEIEKLIFRRMGMETLWLDTYYSYRGDCMLVSNEYAGPSGSTKMSGEPATLLANTIVASALSAYVMDFGSPYVFMFKGDDAVIKSNGLKLSKEKYAIVQQYCKLNMKVVESDVLDFCGCTVFRHNGQDMFVPSLFKLFDKVMAHQIKDPKHFASFVVSIRDRLNVMAQTAWQTSQGPSQYVWHALQAQAELARGYDGDVGSLMDQIRLVNQALWQYADSKMPVLVRSGILKKRREPWFVTRKLKAHEMVNTALGEKLDVEYGGAIAEMM
jgi:hypothetical protein